MRPSVPISILLCVGCGGPVPGNPPGADTVPDTDTDTDTDTVPVDTDTTDTETTPTGCGTAGPHDILDVAAVYRGPSAGNEAGFSIAGGGDLNNDGLTDLIIGSMAAAYVQHGAAEMSSIDLANADALLRNESPGDGAGFSVAALGDIDGDGFGDLVVGASGEQTGGVGAGAAYIVRGPVQGNSDLGTHFAKYTGEAAGDGAARVAGLGDFTGDGLPDLAIGAEFSDRGGPDAGAVYLVVGPTSGLHPLGESATFIGEEAGDLAARVAGVGDTDGDGLRDLVIGAQDWNGGDGRAYLILGTPSPADTDLAQADLRISGSDGVLVGHAVAGLGDIDGDGDDDFYVGAPYWTETLKGAALGFSTSVTGDLAAEDADFRVVGEHDGDRAGFSATGVGDFNGDGKADLLVGAKFEETSGNNSGAAYLLYGPIQGTIQLSAGYDMKFVGEGAGDNFGRTAFAGDVDGDGRDDLLLASRYQSTDQESAGAAYLITCTGLLP